MKKILLSALLICFPAVSQAQDCGWGCGWGHMAGLMMLVWLVAIILIIFGVYTFGRRKWDGSETRTGRKALDILKERYAKGEITREEYERMKKDIED